MGKTARALRLARASWGIVRADPVLMVLPAISTLLLIAVGVIIFVPAGLLIGPSHSKAGYLAVAALASYPLTFVAVFFRFAFVLVVSGRLDGRKTTVRGALVTSWGRRATIARWSLVATVAALLIRGLRQLPLLGGLAGSLASSLLGIAWGAVTFFVVPVIAVEGTNPRRAIDRSASIFRERWGLEALGVVSITGAFAIALLLGVVCVVFAIALVKSSMVAVGVVLCAGVLGLIVLMLAATAVQQTFGIVLYRYATGRSLPAGFSEMDLRGSVRPKRRGMFGR